MGEVACPACHGVEYGVQEFEKHVFRAHDGLLEAPEPPPDRPYRLLLGLVPMVVLGVLLVAGGLLTTAPEGLPGVDVGLLREAGVGLVLVGLLGGADALRRDLRAFEGTLGQADRADQLLFAAWFVPLLGQLLVGAYARRRRRKLAALDEYGDTVRRADDRAGDGVVELTRGEYATAADSFDEAATRVRYDADLPAAYVDLAARNWNYCVAMERQARERAEEGTPTDETEAVDQDEGAGEGPGDVESGEVDAAGGGGTVDEAADRGAADRGAADGGTAGTSAGATGGGTAEGTTDGVDATTGRAVAGPPEDVPAAPDIEVAYDEIDRGERIDSGGRATVTRATVDGVEIAVKEPAPERTLRTEEVERFVAEAETWAKLDDAEGIVTVLGWGTEPHPWLAMEYMDGGHVGERSFGVADAVWTAYRTASTVREAHRQGVAHLDLKPANVLLRETDGWPVPKVADWGLARHLLEEGGVEGLSPRYAAPEQFDERRGEPDNLTDVYALGALTYELVTGRAPFEGAVGEIREQVLDPAVTPAPPSERRAGVPSALDEVVERALATDRDDRYEDVLLLRDDLREVYTGLRD